ncbi:MAG: S-methyl-5-thioribose-1-phosphate isomerase [Lachnospiraceae bacterium]|nr:S-methyl-5-thioribose-1-phosphate isomerase [Lachnospiraceae bacterium]
MSDILSYETVDLDEEKKVLKIIDQTLLPGITQILELTELEDVWEAILSLRVRGAPAIGVAAAMGMYVFAENLAAGKAGIPFGASKEAVNRAMTDPAEFISIYRQAGAYLNSARPTAVNLSWALKRMEDKLCETYKNLTGSCEAGPDQKACSESPAFKEEPAGETGQIIPGLLKVLRDEAVLIKKEDTEVCKKLGENGLTLIKKGDGILTHCNAGQLATSKYGTATAPMYLGHERGYSLKIYCDETRPLLQGARLTSYELSSAGMDVTLLCDNMVSSLMRSGKINAVFVGCDRVAANGDVANKIGTSMVALCAKHYNVPFYVFAPTSTIDMNTAAGDDIKIEQRPADEVTTLWYEKKMAPDDINVYNPAFDITDSSLISAIVTEKGIVYPSYGENLKKLFR